VALPEIAEAAWRPLTTTDGAAMAELHNTCFEVDGGYRIAAAEMEDEFEVFGEHAAEDSIGAFDPDGALQALGWSQLPGPGETEHRVFAYLLVRPDRRGEGVEDALLEWIEQRARQRLGVKIDGLPSALYRYLVYDTMTGDIDLMERHGYTKARFFTESARDLAEPIPEPKLAEGLTARVWSDEISEDSRSVHNAAFADHWGSQPSSRQAWEGVVNEFFLLKASWVVYDGDLPVAYLRSWKYPHNFEDRDRTESWIEGIGTIDSHRGRGIASALLVMAMRTFADDGMEYACLGVDSDSPTGANRLYERLGFIPEKRWMVFRKPLELAGPGALV